MKRDPHSDVESDDSTEGDAGDGGVVELAGDLAAKVVATPRDIGSFIRAQRESAQVSLRQLATLTGVSNPYLSQIERGLRKPSAEVLSQIAKGLRMSSEALYVRAGFLDERPHSPVRDALEADVVLTERQKHTLLEIYETFCRGNASSNASDAGPPDSDDPENPDTENPDTGGAEVVALPTSTDE